MDVSTKIERIGQLARDYERLTTLAHNIDVGWLAQAFRDTRKDAAVGVDGQTAQEYRRDLEGNLEDLRERFMSGRYVAPPVRRVHIPKGNGQTRPLGIPTFEDKVLQRAVTMLLTPIYEQHFLDCSYGFRPGRSAHHALEALRDAIRRMRYRGCWVIDADIRRFFDTIQRPKLREVLRRRIGDGVVLRQIDKWLKAGVWEQGQLHYPEQGTPQGGVLSPLLANILLDEALDQWFERQAKPRLRGRAELIRYADDFVIVVELEQDARKLMEVLPKRLERCGLELHAEKTRLVPFKQPPSGGPRQVEQSGKFDFLGFTHTWGRPRSGRGWTIRQTTAKDRYSRSLKRMNEWLKRYRHMPVAWQHRQLTRKLNGHVNYYNVIGNHRRVRNFWHQTKRLWRKWLGRRSQRAVLTWAAFDRLLSKYPLAQPRAKRPTPIEG